ncbi:MAG: ROK family protein [Infirmifilum sp.]
MGAGFRPVKYALAVDIGATNTRVGIGNSDGELLQIESFKTWDFQDPLKYVEHIARVANGILKSFNVEVVGMGVGSPGPLDIKKGEIINAPNMPFKKLELVKLLKEFTGLRVAFANDAVTAVVGERYWGEGSKHENIVYVTISTGIGGGVYVDGSLLLGKDGNAHEIGHLVVDSQERLTCGCGKKGHWEAYSSGSGIPRFARFLAEVEREKIEGSVLKDRKDIDAPLIFEAYRKGDPLALLVISEVRRLNAYGFAAIVNYYDPEIITVGGSVALNNVDILLNNIRGEVEKYAINRVPDIKPTKLGQNIGIAGALALGLGLEPKIPLR